MVGLWALAFLDGLGERDLGLVCSLGEGLRPLIGVDGIEFEFEFLLCRRASRYSFSPGLVLCRDGLCG